MAEQSGNSDTSTAQSTPPREGGRRRCTSVCSRRPYFNPRPHEGGDLGGRTTVRQTHISIHAPARGATYDDNQPTPKGGISIHAPREGGDQPLSIRLSRHKNFNPRPREGGDYIRIPLVSIVAQFQSTPPARGATVAEAIVRRDSADFNPRPPRGGRLKRSMWFAP